MKLNKFSVTTTFALVLTLFGFSAQAFAYQMFEVVTSTGAYVNVRSAPYTSASIVGKVYDGQIVKYDCYRTGTTVTGYFGTSNIWNRIKLSNGKVGYVSDTYIYTGRDSGLLPCRT